MENKSHENHNMYGILNFWRSYFRDHSPRMPFAIFRQDKHLPLQKTFSCDR